MALMTVLQQVNFYQLVLATMNVEKSEVSNRERFQKMKLYRGTSSSSSKRARESQTESVHSFSIGGRRQGNTVVPSTSRGASAGPGETPKCPHCHRRHLGVCKLLTGGCFKCGSTEHFMANCPKESIGILIVTTEGGPRHHRRLEIKVEVEGARAGIEDEEAQCQRQ